MKIQFKIKSTMVAALCSAVLFSSCGLMDTTSDEKLSGDEMWDGATTERVNGFVNSMYTEFRAAAMQKACYILYSGDLRCAPIESYSSGENYITDLANNDLNGLREHYSGDGNVQADGIMSWREFYKVIQSANILIAEIGRTSVPKAEAEAFKAEAVFMRSLAYFFLVRNFGDVPYYTDAYHQEPLPRTNMVTVLQAIASDLNQILVDDPDAAYLPWAQVSLDKKAIRGSRGAVLALAEHILCSL